MPLSPDTARGRAVLAKQRAVETLLLADPTRSNSEVGRLAGAGHPFVAKVRCELDAAGRLEPPPLVVSEALRGERLVQAAATVVESVQSARAELDRPPVVDVGAW